MSRQPMMFYAVQCDYPSCYALYEAEEYTYSTDPYSDIAEMEEEGWFIGEEGDYCAIHTEQIPCTPDTDGICTVCEAYSGNTDHHGRPFPTTFDGQLRVAQAKYTRQAHEELDSLEGWISVAIGSNRFAGRKSLAYRTDLALRRIHEATCRSWDPSITNRQIALLQDGRALHQRPTNDGVYFVMDETQEFEKDRLGLWRDRLIVGTWRSRFSRFLVWVTCECRRNGSFSTTADSRGVQRCDACGRQDRSAHG